MKCDMVHHLFADDTQGFESTHVVRDLGVMLDTQMIRPRFLNSTSLLFQFTLAAFALSVTWL